MRHSPRVNCIQLVLWNKQIRESLLIKSWSGVSSSQLTPYMLPQFYSWKRRTGGLACAPIIEGLMPFSCVMCLLPLIWDLLGVVSKGKIFNKLDLRDAYFSMYFYHSVGAGWIPSNVIQAARGLWSLHEPDKGVIIYLDDVLIYSNDFDSHVKLVRDVLKTFHKNKLYIKFSKCEFHKELDFLEYWVYPYSQYIFQLQTALKQNIFGWKVTVYWHWNHWWQVCYWNYSGLTSLLVVRMFLGAAAAIYEHNS